MIKSATLLRVHWIWGFTEPSKYSKSVFIKVMEVKIHSFCSPFIQESTQKRPAYMNLRIGQSFACTCRPWDFPYLRSVANFCFFLEWKGCRNVAFHHHDFSLHILYLLWTTIGKGETSHHTQTQYVHNMIASCFVCKVNANLNPAWALAWPHFWRTQLHSPPNGYFCPRIWTS